MQSVEEREEGRVVYQERLQRMFCKCNQSEVIMDKQLRAEVIQTVANAMKTYNEKWVTADVLCEHVGTLTPRWLKDHGQAFNRTRVEWNEKDANGNVRHVVSKDWLYPLNEIKEWIMNGKIKELTS